MFRIHAQGLIARIPRTRRWRVAHYGRYVMGTSLYPRKHHFPRRLLRRRVLIIFAKNKELTAKDFILRT